MKVKYKTIKGMIVEPTVQTLYQDYATDAAKNGESVLPFGKWTVVRISKISSQLTYGWTQYIKATS